MNFFNTFFTEKNLTEETYEVTSANGTPNLIPTSAVIDAIKRTQGTEAQQIEKILRQIDFANATVASQEDTIAGGGASAGVGYTTTSSYTPTTTSSSSGY